jgi:hypothetical protein
MADPHESGNQETKRKLNKDLLLGIIFAIFVIVSIAGMVAIDVLGEAKMGGKHQVQDAAEK